jgi:nanoRNase/pAp phosphatase (c-di-AMP/oligoRNAs hydrolase)
MSKKPPDSDGAAAADTNGTKEWFGSLELQPRAKVAIVTHDTPDPDAIGAALACQWIFRRKFQAESTIFCKGSVSHPQNKTVVNLLNIDLQRLGDDDLSSYALRVVVDATPATWSRTGESGKIAFDAYFDHHPKAALPQKWSGHADYRHAGSACAIMRSVMRELGMEFDADSEDDQIIATAMVVGIRTDTEEMSVDDTSEIDLLALAELHPFVTQKILRQIIRYPVPKLWYELRRKAEEEAASEGSALVTGLGFLTQESRDALAWVADDLERRDGVDTCVAFGIIEDRIVGVVRCSNPTLELNDFVRRVFGEDSVGGGKRGKAAATAPLGQFFSSYTESSKAKLWDAVRIITTERAFKAASGQ